MGDRVELTALVTAVPGREDDLKSCLLAVAEQSLREDGCIELRVFEQTDRPGSFVLWEIFESSQALALHVSTEYIREYFESDLVETRQVIRHRLL